MDGIPSHWNVGTVNLEPVFGGVEPYAEVVDDAVEALPACAGAERSRSSATAWAGWPRAATCAATGITRCSAW